MIVLRLITTLLRVLLAVALLAGAVISIYDINHPGNQPGRFDFYMLSLSWSPTNCQSLAEQRAPPGVECSASDLGFVVHGLWPERTSDYPHDCQFPAPALSPQQIASARDIIPSDELVLHEWQTHGTCSALNAESYFFLLHRARHEVKIPPQYVTPHSELSVSPDTVIADFLRANPDLERSALAIDCTGERLNEVHVCFSKTLGPHACPPVTPPTCTAKRVSMPPVHGQ